MRELVRRYWRTLTSPSAYYSLGFLTIGGFIGGILFWGAFNTAMEFTNTERFCIGCHVMRDNVYQEIQPTIHFTNRSGVRAKCADCHVPHEWTFKMARKMQASKEVWGFIFGTISTREKFLAKGDRTCIDCHKGIAHRLPDMAGQ
jgi:cytochrome c-type protein NapC